MVIINPRAGKLKSKTALFDITETLFLAGYDPTVQITSGKGDGTTLAKKAALGKYDLVVCCGGDGTLNEVASGVISSGSEIPIGYIPAGTTNDFAKTLGLSIIPRQATLDIVNGVPTKIDAGKFGEDRFFNYIASFGIFTAASYNTLQSTKNIFGHLAYILEGIKDLGAVRPYNVTVTSNGKTYSGDYIFGGVTNSTSVGGIVKLEKRLVDLSDGLFEVVLVKNPRDVAEFGRVLVGIANSDLSDSMFEFFKSSEITFRSEEEFPWALDGEEADPGNSVTIKNIKGAITLLR